MSRNPEVKVINKGENWLLVEAQVAMDNLRMEEYRIEGQKQAYNRMIDLMNPEKRCQICGEEYATWRGNDDRAKHEATHIQVVRPEAASVQG